MSSHITIKDNFFQIKEICKQTYAKIQRYPSDVLGMNYEQNLKQILKKINFMFYRQDFLISVENHLINYSKSFEEIKKLNYFKYFKGGILISVDFGALLELSPRRLLFP